MILRLATIVLVVLPPLMPFAGCVDATHDDQVAALGPEDPDGPPGPFHRPGQPCLTCHGGSGPASKQFSVGGTIYALEGQPAPAVGATVQIEDIAGRVGTAQSNRVGNFYLTEPEWTPTYPTLPQVTLGGVNQQMITHVGVDGSCAGCHQDPAGPTSAGHIYIMTSTATVSDGGP